MILALKQKQWIEVSEISDKPFIKAADMSSLEMELDSVKENFSDDILSLSTADIQARTRLLDNEV